MPKRMLKRIIKSLNRFQSKALVLMYHKISTPGSDPWELAVSPENFEAHLKILKKRYVVIGIDELVHRLKNKSIKRNAIAITFDDGYLNNYTVAKPLLEQYNTSASFFITDDNLMHQQPFWWDELEEIILHTKQLPQNLSLNFNSKVLEFDLRGETTLNQHLEAKHTQFVAYEPPTLRAGLYYMIWQIMSPLPKKEQVILLNQIKQWASFPAANSKIEKCMTLEQLKELSENSLFIIGGHTKSHPALAHHPKKIQQEEILENKAFLEKELKRKINFFAYPSGNYNEETLALMQESEFEAAFNTNPYPVKGKTNIFKINRFQVNNWNGENFEMKLQNWFRL